jgi:large subunit ribosomal protein L27
MGKDHTLYAKVNGRIQFKLKGPARRQTVSVVPA